MKSQKTDFVRSEGYRRFIASLPCTICKTPHNIQAAHVRYIAACGTSLKPSDEHCLPLCVPHHSEQHYWPTGEESWWEVRGMDPKAVTETLWDVWGRNWPQGQKWETAEDFLNGYGHQYEF